MAVGKNKKGAKTGKKGAKRKIVDPFTKKDWYDLKAPSTFSIRNIGKTLVNRTSGTKIASEALKGRVVEVSLSELIENNDEAYRKFKLVVEEVQGKTCLTNFHGMDFTRDMLCSKIKKRFTMIEAHADVKTTDGYLLRLFCIGFTQREERRRKVTCYAKHTQVRAIRRIVVETMQRDVSSSNLREVIDKLKPDSIAKEIERKCSSVRPIHDVYIRKVKVLRKPKFDLSRLLFMHGEGGGAAVINPSKTSDQVFDEDEGVRVDRPDHYEFPFQQEV